MYYHDNRNALVLTKYPKKTNAQELLDELKARFPDVPLDQIEFDPEIENDGRSVDPVVIVRPVQ